MSLKLKELASCVCFLEQSVFRDMFYGWSGTGWLVDSYGLNPATTCKLNYISSGGKPHDWFLFSLFQSLQTDAQNPFRQIHHGNATRIRSMILLMNWNHRSRNTNIYFNCTKQRKKVIIPNINRLCQSCISGHTALPCRMFEVWLLEVLPRTGSLKYFSLFLDKHELIFIQKSNLRS